MNSDVRMGLGLELVWVMRMATSVLCYLKNSTLLLFYYNIPTTIPIGLSYSLIECVRGEGDGVNMPKLQANTPSTKLSHPFIVVLL